MYRTYIFALGILALIALGMTTLAYVMHNDLPQKATTGSAGTFSGAQTNNQLENLFWSNEGAAGTTTSNLQEEIVLTEILQSWEARSGSNVHEYPSPNTSSPSVTGTTVQQKGIKDIFNELLGIRITDSLKGDVASSPMDESFIWTGGYSNSNAPVIIEQQSAAQVALRAYGNELGSLLTTFNTNQGDQVALLDVFFEDRSKTVGLRALTNAYIELSAEIAAINAPAAARMTHERLSAAYKEVGTLLWELTTAQNDTELVDRILIYNKSSEAVVKQHIALVTLFKAYGITFDAGDPGRVFVFPSQR